MSEPLNVEKCKMCSDRIICNYTDGMMCQEKLIAEIKRLRGENERLWGENERLEKQIDMANNCISADNV